MPSELANEIIAKRTESNKVYDLGGGKRRLECHCKPIHYKNGKGWEDIVLDFRDELSQFISDKNKVSCGFRKDGLTAKYLGLRYDYDHQLELTLAEVKIDGTEKVGVSNTLTKEKASELKCQLDTGAEIIARLNEVSLTTLVKVSQPIGDFRLTDEIHLKGFKVDNKKIGDSYIPDEHGRFNFINKDTEELAFWIRPPYFEEATGERSRNLQHSLYEQNGKLLYTKVPTKAGQDDLVLAQYPILIDTNIYYSSTKDGYVIYDAGADSWDDAHDAVTGDVAVDNGNSYSYAMGAHGDAGGKGEDAISRSFFYFDTSDLEAGWTVDTAVLKIYGFANQGSDVSAQKGTQAATLTVNDLRAFEGTEFGHVTWALAKYNDITFSSPNTQVIKAGTTKICCREYTHDYLDADPGDFNFRNGCYYAEEALTTRDPRLDVDYTPTVAIPRYPAVNFQIPAIV